KCPTCGRTLNPYRAKGRYVYYECKNPETRCGVCVAQTALVEQLHPLLSGAFLNSAEIEELRTRLLTSHRRRSAGEIGHRRGLNEQYEKLQQEIGELFTQRQEAEALGIQDAVDLRLQELKRKRDGLQAQLNVAHEKGTVV